MPDLDQLDNIPLQPLWAPMLKDLNSVIKNKCQMTFWVALSFFFSIAIPMEGILSILFSWHIKLSNVPAL